MAQVVYTNVTGDVGVVGTLFQGMKIWFAQRVPQRQRFVQLVQANGGEVTPLEKNADIKLVDDARKEAPPGTYSYKFVELSIRNRQLEDLEDHTVGPPAGTARTIGSITRPAKGTRTAFTAEDDRVLFDWITASEQAGGKTAGNEIYKQLEQTNSRHPWQAWRDRWIKQLHDKPRPAPAPRQDSPSVHSDQGVKVNTVKKEENVLGESNKQMAMFSPKDVKNLLGHAEDILNILPENLTDAWANWASEFPSHSAWQWKDFWEKTVLPLHVKREAARTVEVSDEPSPGLSHPRIELRKPAIDGPTPLLGSGEMSSPSKRMQMSPSYQPISPRLQVNKQAGADQVERGGHLGKGLVRDERSTTTDSESLFLPSLEAPVESSRSSKRKRIAAEVDELPHSSPLKTTHAVNKRSRQASSQEPLEVPSTPEQTQRELGTPFDPVNGVIDIDSDDESASDGLGLPPSQSLSEPSNSAYKAQPTFKDPTRYLDLEVVPPEGGWESDGAAHTAQPTFKDPTRYLDLEVVPPEGGWESDEAASQEFGKAPEIDETQARRSDTQALLAGQTQVADFSLPEPDGGWDDLMPSSPPRRVPASSQTAEVAAEEELESDTEENEADITARLDKWIDSHVAAGMEAEDVALALKCTSMEADLAEDILPYLAKHKTIPGDVRGVWTDEDDEDLYASDGRRITRLQEKHGQEGFDARWEFLRIYRGSA
ncbi:MAG: hypothetical protein LQ347_005213, partial [Umbilicaria vellea]